MISSCAHGAVPTAESRPCKGAQGGPVSGGLSVVVAQQSSEPLAEADFALGLARGLVGLDQPSPESLVMPAWPDLRIAARARMQ